MVLYSRSEETIMWPGNLKSIELCGGMNFTELWMLKERMVAGHIKMLQQPEKAWPERNGRWNTLYGDESGTWCICTEGIHGVGPHQNTDYCNITRINKLTTEHASKLLSGWPYD